MKTKHLLAALALPIVFSACNQEELITNNVDKEVVGTPIGVDLKFNASFGDPSTRLAVGEDGAVTWELEDKLSLGWISADGLTASANLFANHPLFCNDVDKNSFESRTMVYEGLYVASFPFQPTQKVDPLVFDLSEQKSEESYLAGRWHVSKEFFELTAKTAGMEKATEIEFAQLTNLMKLNIKLAEGAAAKLPADFKVLGVTLGDTGGKLVNKMTLKTASNTSIVAKDKTTLVAGAWTDATGDIKVTVENGTIDATNGLDVYVQMGVFSATDATTLKIHTNYGDAIIKTGTESVTWSSPVKYLNQATASKVATFLDAVKAMQLKAVGKEYGQNVSVNVTLDETKLDATGITVSKQEDIDNAIKALTGLDKLGEDITITFTKSDLKKDDKVVAADGDVIITDFSGLNTVKGAITFEKDATDPTNVYISGDIALQAKPTVTDVNFTVMNGKTLTVSKDLNIGDNDILVEGNATLINKATLTATNDASGGTGILTTTAAVMNTDGITVKVPAGKYISEVGATLTVVTFTNNGEVIVKGGVVPVTTAGKVTATATTLDELYAISGTLDAITGNATNVVTIPADAKFDSQIANMELGGIKELVINGNVAFNLARNATPFDFSDLAKISIKKGSLSLTGGNAGTAEDAFYTLEVADECAIALAEGTSLNLAAGTKIALGAAGKITYSKATVVNNGFIATGVSEATEGSWTGNAIGVNPKKVVVP